MPATPMKEAADRYSPEIAEAFHPTDTERPATKKSPAVFDLPADQKPIAIVTTTVTSEKVRIHGSTAAKSIARLPGAAHGESLYAARVHWSGNFSREQGRRKYSCSGGAAGSLILTFYRRGGIRPAWRRTRLISSREHWIC